VVADQMARLGGFRDLPIGPTIASPAPWQYRSHVTFHVTEDGRPGFIATDDQHSIPIEECHIIRPELLDLFRQLDLTEIDDLDRIRLQVGTRSDDLLVALSTRDNAPPGVEIDLPISVSFLSGDDEPETLIGRGYVEYSLRGRVFRVTAGSFFQVNLAQAETLVDLALERLQLQGSESVLDLFAGVGLFTAFLAERAALVTYMESFPTAVDDAEANLADFANVEMVEGLVEDVLPELDGPFDAALLDPPRSGLEPAALDALAELAPPKIVYVSCDVATFARDAKRLAAKGYQLRDVQPVDMFPQTYHIELVGTFAR
jgi:23S rRNA (uracil1939-C5)-methyltransferase